MKCNEITTTFTLLSGGAVKSQTEGDGISERAFFYDERNHPYKRGR